MSASRICPACCRSVAYRARVWGICCFAQPSATCPCSASHKLVSCRTDMQVVHYLAQPGNMPVWGGCWGWISNSLQSRDTGCLPRSCLSPFCSKSWRGGGLSLAGLLASVRKEPLKSGEPPIPPAYLATLIYKIIWEKQRTKPLTIFAYSQIMCEKLGKKYVRIPLKAQKMRKKICFFISFPVFICCLSAQESIELCDREGLWLSCRKYCRSSM